jgi:hypothetical protein
VSSPTPDRLVVEWSARFRRYMTQLRVYADPKPTGAHAQMLRALERVSSGVVAHPELCFLADYALKDDLRGIRRYKLGRGRLFYIASPEKRMAIILHFGETRRAGDPKRDAYAEFRRLLRSTEFDRLFPKLGLVKPSP